MRSAPAASRRFELAGPQIEFLDRAAAGEQLDAFNDFGAVHKELISDDGVGDVNDEAALALDPDGV